MKYGSAAAGALTDGKAVRRSRKRQKNKKAAFRVFPHLLQKTAVPEPTGRAVFEAFCSSGGNRVPLHRRAQFSDAPFFQGLQAEAVVPLHHCKRKIPDHDKTRSDQTHQQGVDQQGCTMQQTQFFKCIHSPRQVSRIKLSR